jgi:hypothetical protein
MPIDQELRHPRFLWSEPVFGLFRGRHIAKQAYDLSRNLRTHGCPAVLEFHQSFQHVARGLPT